MQEQDIEIQVWDYIDNECSSEDNARISKLITTDKIWLTKYQELLSVHHSLQTELKTEQVSSGFAATTMSKLSPKASTPQKLKPFFTWSIRAVVAFFIISISGFTIYSLSITDWTLTSYITPETSQTITDKLPSNYLVFGILIFGLLCADLLFKRNVSKL